MSAWHVDDLALERWVEGTDGSASGASVEQHLLRCEECRARVPAPAELAPVWELVRDEIELPPVSRLERLLRRVGLSGADARIIRVSPAFRVGWVVGLTVLLTFVAFAGGHGAGRGQWVFLLIAPLVPALGVALGYDPELDAALDQECATPYPALRLVLLRSAALLLGSLPVLLLASLLVPAHLALLWLVPAAVCTTLVLALSNWLTPLAAVGAVASVWFVVVSVAARGSAPAAALDEGHLALYAAAGVAALVVVRLRGRRFVRLGGGNR